MDELIDIEKNDFKRVLDIYVQHTYKPLSNKAEGCAKSVNGSDKALSDEQGFVSMLTPFINEKGLSDSFVSEKYNTICRYFDGLKSDFQYNSAKYQLLGFCFVLNLSLSQVNSVLTKAGFVLSSSDKADVIVQFFLKNECYDLDALKAAFKDYDII